MHAPTISLRFAIVFALSLAAPTAAQWQQISPPTMPGPRVAPAMSTDAIGNVLLFGGDTGTFPTPYTDSTWTFSGGDWTQLPTATAPSPRFEAGMVFDSFRGVHVLYGGWTSIFSVGSGNDETWEFDGNTWTQANPPTTPGGRWKHAMCFDPLRNVTIVYGGATSGLPGASNETWEYNGLTWTQATPAGTPGPRENAAMCFHFGLGSSVLFGGVNPLSGISNDTWVYNGLTWQQIPTAGTWPSARTAMDMVYDPVRAVCIMTGGIDGAGNPLDDTWEFDGSSWTQQPTTGAAGHNFGLTFDPLARVAIRYGGFGNTGQTWLYGATTRTFGNGCAGSNGVPALTAADAPRLGANYSLTLSNLNAGIPLAVIVLSQSETAPVPLDPIGMIGCSAHVTPDLLVSVAAAGGNATWTGAIPVTATLLGASIFAQGLSIDPNVNAAWLTSSNGHQGVLGQ